MPLMSTTTVVAREGHENHQSLYAIPAREQGHGGEHDEDEFPMEAVDVEAVGEHHGEDHACVLWRGQN